VLEEDGTDVEDDDYLSSLDHATELVLLPPWESYSCWSERLQSVMRKDSSRVELMKAVRPLIASDRSERVENYVAKLPVNEKSRRDEDAAWFAGFPPRYTTKEQVMRERAKSRMRNYLRDAKAYLSEQVRFQRRSDNEWKIRRVLSVII
jgi:hypothetical protein